MYDVRFSMYDFDFSALCAEGAEQMRTGCPGAVGGETPPMYDGRCTMYDLEIPALARELGEVCRLVGSLPSSIGGAWETG